MVGRTDGSAAASHRRHALFQSLEMDHDDELDNDNASNEDKSDRDQGVSACGSRIRNIHGIVAVVDGHSRMEKRLRDKPVQYAKRYKQRHTMHKTLEKCRKVFPSDVRG